MKSKLSPNDIVLLFEPSSPIVIDEFANLSFAIEPASWALVIPAVLDKLVVVKPVIDCQ